MFNWEGFKKGEFVVSCNTPEKAQDFIDKCVAKGIKWSNGNKPYETYWDENGPLTCYRYYKYGLLYGRCVTYVKESYDVKGWSVDYE